MSETVRILPNGKVKDGHRRVQIGKNSNHEVLFVALGNGGPWKIVFDKPAGNPFVPSSIRIPQGSFKSSGPPKSGMEGRFPYSVFDANDRLKDDPDVDIE